MRLNEFDEKERLEKANKKLKHYKTAAGADATAADAAGNFARGNRRFKGINAATNKQFDNDAKLAKLKEQGVAEGVDSENNPWHVTDVDAVSETDFEVALQGPAGIKLNFVIRPVDFVETQRERYQIDSMDVRDLQSGKTMHWGSMQNLGKWEPIFDAIDEHFWMDRSLQAHLAKIVDYYMDAGEHGKNPDMMSDLDKRDPNGIAVSAKDFVASHNQADAAIKSAKEGVAEDDDAVAAFLARGGEIQQLKPQRGPKRSGVGFASKHIGSGSGRGNTKGKVSGLGANTGKSGKPVVTAEQGVAEGEKHGLYYNVNKRKAAGTSRPASSPKAPTAQAWKDAAKTAKNESVAEDQLDELSKDTIRNYLRAQPARIKGPAGLATTDNKKAARIVDPVKGDIRRAMDKYKDPEYGQQRPRLPEDSLAAMRRLAGVTTLPPAAVPNGARQYRHMPTAVQPR